MSSPSALPAGTLVDGRYRIDGPPIGAGGMGTVYRAVQEVIGRRVAVKVLRPDIAAAPGAVARFHREARAASQLTHPNVVTVHDFGQLPDGAMYLVLEFIDGLSLHQVQQSVGRLPVDRVGRIMGQVLDALEEAHSQGIVHRDLKPENVLLSHHAGNVDFVKVVDFGLARVQDEVTLTEPGELFGTPLYLSPEQARGQRADHRADLYAVGVMIFEMLVGRPPFEASSSMAVLMKHMRAQAPRFTDVWPEARFPPALEAVVLTALQKDPTDRFQRAAEMRDALLRAVAEAEDGAGTETLREVTSPLGGAMVAARDAMDAMDAGLAPTVDPSGMDSHELGAQVRAAAEAMAFEDTPVPDPPPASDTRDTTFGLEPTMPADVETSAQIRAAVDEAAGAAARRVGGDSIDLVASGWRPDRRIPLLAAGAAVAVLLGVGAWWATSDEAPAPAARPDAALVVAAPPAAVDAAPPAPDAAPLARHAVTLRSTPPGAAVELALRRPDGETSTRTIDATPAEVQVVEGSQVEARFHLADHDDTTVVVTVDGPRTVLGALPSRAPDAAATPPRPVARRRAPRPRPPATPTPPKPAPPAVAPDPGAVPPGFVDDLK
ncbi:MAG: serine/threonine protein kinase [Myxococcales bacterium]|nr:serine/threonine protein kinase [Myxococcales bacterium]